MVEEAGSRLESKWIMVGGWMPTRLKTTCQPCHFHADHYPHCGKNYLQLDSYFSIYEISDVTKGFKICPKNTVDQRLSIPSIYKQFEADSLANIYSPVFPITAYS